MNKNIIAIAGISGVIAVVLGALGAHALKSQISPELLTSFKTGNAYHTYHTLALLVLGFMTKADDRLLNISAKLFMIGIVLFSGSIYLLSTREILGIESWKWLGPITPIGGLFFIAGWATIAYFGLKKR